MLSEYSHFLQQLRKHFHNTNCQEVITPSLNRYPSTDQFIEQFFSGNYSLRTSPEFHMKRLLCRYKSDIFQIGSAFRKGETSAKHIQEFTMLEWYRVNTDYLTLCRECIELLADLTNYKQGELFEFEQLFSDCYGKPSSEYTDEQLQTFVSRETTIKTVNTLDRNNCIEALTALGKFSKCLNPNVVNAIINYPTSQCLQAEIDAENKVSKRFEVYLQGVELANGYQELTDPLQLCLRMRDDLRRRRKEQRKIPTTFAWDRSLLQEMKAGMPPCSGVAVGLDRAFMLRQRQTRLADVLQFSSELKDV